MENALEVRGLCKAYPSFSLDHLSFTLPAGCVMGFIGENGAGKSTTIKAVLNLVRCEEGTISVFGRDHRAEERAIKQQLGIVLEDSTFPGYFRGGDVDRVLRAAYPAWDSGLFYCYLKRFAIEPDKKISSYSKGMRMKLSIAAALSHHARLLLLDEPTSGLDPVARDEVLDLFWEFLQEEDHSVLMSTHITSDLDKISDYITFLHQGRILLTERRDELLDTLGILRCTPDMLQTLGPHAVLASHVGTYGAEALVRRNRVGSHSVEPVNIEQIMLFFIRKEALAS